MKPLTEADVGRLFNEAMDLVRGYVTSSDLHCSTGVRFAGLTDEVYAPARLSRDRAGFTVDFSRNFLLNRPDKVRKLLVRLIATTNADGTFKTYREVREELKKLPFDTHYDVSFQNDYLVGYPDEPVNAAVCHACGRMFRYPPGAPELTQPRHLRCRCGGAMTVIVNGVKLMSANDVERYRRCNPKLIDKLRNVDLSPLARFSAEVQAKVRTVISKGRVNARTIRPVILEALDAGDAELLRALDAVTELTYRHVFNGLGRDRQLAILDLAPPSTLNVEVERRRIDAQVGKGRSKGTGHREVSSERVETKVLDPAAELRAIFFGPPVITPAVKAEAELADRLRAIFFSEEVAT